MVLYNPKEWWRLIFAFHKSDTFRMILPGMMSVAIYTLLVAYLENDYFEVKFKNTTAIHSLVGFVLSMLLVFRTNTAYERWWDGRKLWGQLNNDARNLAMKINAYTQDIEIRKTFHMLICNFVFALKDQLRGEKNLNEMYIDEKYNIDFYKKFNHLPNGISSAMYQEVVNMHKNEVISGEQLLFLNEQLQTFVNVAGGCERIKNTPIPYSYSLFIKKVIFLYVFTMPIGFVREFGYWAAPIVALIFYVFTSIELIAEEIEDPFGEDTNDLPINQICENIDKNTREILSLN
jgi:putative membrane protein